MTGNRAFPVEDDRISLDRVKIEPARAILAYTDIILACALHMDSYHR